MFLTLSSRRVRPNPRDILLHYAAGYMPDFLNGKSGEVGWVRWSHRGIQFLEKFKIPRKQKNYVLSPEFEVRINQSFEEVVRECADLHRHAIKDGVGQTWLIPDLIEGFLKLHKMGYAHSYEAWHDGKLAGGTFGIQLGGLLTMISLFHRISNASKAAAGRAMMLAKERGFQLIDIGMVPAHQVDFGSEWLPRWKYESMLPALIQQRLSISDQYPHQPIPFLIRTHLPILRIIRSIHRRLPTRPNDATPPAV
jgi:leucyl/phenylalanyl-tRNA--protein transferase